MKEIQSRDTFFLVEKLIQNVECTNFYENRTEKNPEIIDVIENNYEIVYHSLFSDITESFFGYIHSLDPSEISTELTPIKFKYYSLQTEKIQEISFYDYYGHLEKFGFEWEDKSLIFKYTVEFSPDKTKIMNNITMGKKQDKFFSSMNLEYRTLYRNRFKLLMLDLILLTTCRTKH